MKNWKTREDRMKGKGKKGRVKKIKGRGKSRGEKGKEAG